MNRFLLLFLALTLPAFGQVPPSKAVKLNPDDTYLTPTATELWTANPLTPTFITQTPSALLSNEQALSSMSTGVIGVTTGTGALNSFSDSAGLRTALSDETGTGVLVFATTPTLVTPILGVATATSINGLGITTTTGTLTIANSKTATISNTLTFTGTDSSSVAFGAGGTVGYSSTDLSQFASTTSAQLAGVISNETGTGLLVFSTSPALITPTLGVAAATSVNGLIIDTTTGTLDLTNGKTLAVSNTLTFSGTDAAAVNFAAGGTVPYVGGTLAQFSNTTSAELAGVISNETGTGALVFGSNPTLSAPILGAATATTINGLTITTTTGGILTVASSKTFTASNTLTFAGTDGSTLNIGAGGVLGTLAFASSVSASDGGTGFASYAVGDLLVANGTTSLAKLADIATGNVLLSGGVAAVPLYGKVTTSHTTGIAASGANTDITSIGPMTGTVTSTVAGATTSLPGTIEIATTTEAAAMTDSARSVTPQGIASALNSARIVAITADDQTITVGVERTIQLTSDSTGPNRTFKLSSGTLGQVLTIQMADAGLDLAEMDYNVLNQLLNGDWHPSSGDCIMLFYDGSLWREIDRSDKNLWIAGGEVIIGQWYGTGGPVQTLYRKTINIGALPNAGTTTDAHGVTGGVFLRLYGYCTDGTNYLPLPYPNTSATSSIYIEANATNITTGAGTNRTAFTGYVTLEYTK